LTRIATRCCAEPATRPCLRTSVTPQPAVRSISTLR
jgi:hypothetical protein